MEAEMGLNIKNEETCRLAAELAELTGDTMTGAITKALEKALEQEQRKRDVEEKVKEIREFLNRSGGSGGLTSADVDRLLYDERGLPK
jgi:antitoxin VapB